MGISELPVRVIIHVGTNELESFKHAPSIGRLVFKDTYFDIKEIRQVRTYINTCLADRISDGACYGELNLCARRSYSLNRSKATSCVLSDIVGSKRDGNSEFARNISRLEQHISQDLQQHDQPPQL